MSNYKLDDLVAGEHSLVADLNKFNNNN